MTATAQITIMLSMTSDCLEALLSFPRMAVYKLLLFHVRIAIVY